MPTPFTPTQGPVPGVHPRLYHPASAGHRPRPTFRSFGSRRPTVHRMIDPPRPRPHSPRNPGQARSITLLVPPERLPPLQSITIPATGDECDPGQSPSFPCAQVWLRPHGPQFMRLTVPVNQLVRSRPITIISLRSGLVGPDRALVHAVDRSGQPASAIPANHHHFLALRSGWTRPCSGTRPPLAGEARTQRSAARGKNAFCEREDAFHVEFF